MTLLTGGHLQKISRNKHRPLMDELASAFNHWLPHYGITDDEEISQILANVAVETGGYRTLRENMNYSEKRLKQVFSYYKRNPKTARAHSRKPELIANTVYADKNRSKRYKLGNIHEGDGWLFRGNGPPQLTGRYHHENFKKLTGLDVVNHPELLSDPFTGVQALCVFYTNKRGLQEKARAGDTRGTRKLWNGGSHGLSQIEDIYLPRARSVMRAVEFDQSIGIDDEFDPVGPDGDDVDVYVDSSSSVELIKTMQRLLNEKRYKCGAVDGDIGAETRSAMRRFLDRQGLPVEPLRVSLDVLEDAEPYVNDARNDLSENEAKEILIEKGSRHMTSAGRKKWAGGALATASVLGSTAEQVGDNVETVQNVTSQVKGALSPFQWMLDLAISYWWLIFPAIGIYLWIEGDLAQKLRVKIWKTAEHS